MLWEELHKLLSNVNLRERGWEGEQDSSRWCLEKSGCYTTKSMYRFLAHRGVINIRMRRLWKTKLPMKLKVFMWQVFHDRLQTGEELKKRNWKGNEKCLVCGVIETRDHILFECPLAKITWVCCKEAMGWARVLDLQTVWRRCGEIRSLWLC